MRKERGVEALGADFDGAFGRLGADRKTGRKHRRARERCEAHRNDPAAGEDVEEVEGGGVVFVFEFMFEISESKVLSSFEKRRKVKDKAGSVFGPTASTTLFRRRRRPFCQWTGTNEKSADSIVRVDALSEGFTSPVRRCVETPQGSRFTTSARERVLR